MRVNVIFKKYCTRLTLTGFFVGCIGCASNSAITPTTANVKDYSPSDNRYQARQSPKQPPLPKTSVTTPTAPTLSRYPAKEIPIAALEKITTYRSPELIDIPSDTIDTEPYGSYQPTPREYTLLKQRGMRSSRPCLDRNSVAFRRHWISTHRKLKRPATKFVTNLQAFFYHRHSNTARQVSNFKPITRNGYVNSYRYRTRNSAKMPRNSRTFSIISVSCEPQASTWAYNNSPDAYQPVNKSHIHQLISKAAQRHQVDEKLVRAVIQTESAYNANAKSSAGAVGLMQLMPDTAKRYGVVDRKNPGQNIDGGTRYLKYLLGLFNYNLDLAVAAYNAGEHAVMRYNYSIPPYPETRNYVRQVLALYNR